MYYLELNIFPSSMRGEQTFLILMFSTRCMGLLIATSNIFQKELNKKHIIIKTKNTPKTEEINSKSLMRPIIYQLTTISYLFQSIIVPL